MSSFVFMTDSTIDLPHELTMSMNIEIIPLHYIVDGKEYVNTLIDPQLSSKEFYDAMRSGSSTSTSQISSYTFVTSFEPFLKQGKDIIYLALSSALSGTYQQAVQAANELGEIYPTQKIAVIDSLSACMGEGLIAYMADKHIKNGASFDDTVNFIKDIRLKVCHWLTVDDLSYLRRTGRVSATSAFFGNMLNIKPVIHIDDNGKLVAVAKARGRKKAISAIIDVMEKTGLNINEQVVFISHADNLEDVTSVAGIIKEKFNPVDIIIGSIGPVIGCHAGPGTISIFFIGAPR